MASHDTKQGPPSDDQGQNPWRVEGLSTDRRGGTDDGKPPSRLPSLRFVAILLALLVVNFFVYQLLRSDEPSRLEIPYSTFREEVQAENVEEVNSRGDTIEGEFRAEVTYEGDAATLFETERPTFAGDDGLLQLLIDQGVVVDATPTDSPPPLWQTLLFGFGPTLLLVALFVLAMRFVLRRGPLGGLGGIGQSKAKLADPTARRATFEDVAGIDDAEDELKEIVDFLRNPDRYLRLGAAIPKGVLLSGLPGTGKTLLAKAVAGEAGAPFFSLSASEFVEMIVGVGASRVRDLFETAKKAAPAIIFIDELDAIGRARGSGQFVSGHDEREQTLNQILTEMDGFTGSEGVIVLAATNRPEILDPALLRPGRFDRRVTVNPPDLNGRQAILEVHAREVPLGVDVDLNAVAASTPGFVGADLKNLVNEAALTAARRGHEQVHMGDFTDAFEKLLLGAERNILLTQEEKARTAYHESGHALIGMLTVGADPVRKISIIPRGRALGVTLQSPDADRYDFDAAYLRGKIVGLMGGRAAEQVIYGNVTTGAESDLEKATDIARRMVGRWGMSAEIGPVAVLPGPNDQTYFPGVDPVAPRTRELVDEEVRRIVEGCYDQALQTLTENRQRLDALANTLLARETLDEADIYQVVGIERLTPLPR